MYDVERMMIERLGQDIGHQTVAILAQQIAHEHVEDDPKLLAAASDAVDRIKRVPKEPTEQWAKRMAGELVAADRKVVAGQTYQHFRGGRYTVVLSDVLGVLYGMTVGPNHVLMRPSMEASQETAPVMLSAEYEVPIIAVDNAAAIQMYVVYCSHENGKLWIRSQREFLEHVENKPLSIRLGSKKFYTGPRFILINQDE